MSPESPAEMTLEHLGNFLCRIGFEQPAKMDHSLAFRHLASGTVIVLSIPAPGQRVRPADLLSVLTRLENQGLVDDQTLAAFKIGRLPKAS
jgi:hypothetical protein